ncbi:oxidoreductase [Laetiporus sulphureus 93-53]|uniref:Oxidoreductase n=1 Tax=Laetiporus sulphureus 93-53 TaxID=1314785 RepID=A0A165IBU2_9APHY|nr:oxidoreductase [Laetiporus sulphureus 93-53]KZT12863.1 oxidoreductase [Laetiporus sulphureus 93-53]
MPTRPIKTAVLGLGLGGLTFHIPFLLALPAHFTLHAVLERTPDPAQPKGKVAARFGAIARDVRVYRTLAEVLGDGEVELVVVSTPSGMHCELARRGLEAGKHAGSQQYILLEAKTDSHAGTVLVDKPVTATAAEARELAALAKARGLVLYPYQNCRFNADFLALRKLLALPPDDPRSLGTLVEFESRYDRYRTTIRNSWKDVPAPANGLTYDLGSHLIDQALVLFGRPEKITAFIENVRGVGSEEVDDCFTIFLRYPPRPAAVHTDVQPTSLTVILRSHILSVRSPQLRYVVRGTTGTYTKFGIDVQEAQLKAMASPTEIVDSPSYGREPEELWGTLENLAADGAVSRTTWSTSERGSYAALFVNLAETIREGKAQVVKWEEASDVIEMIELAYRSAREERTVPVPPFA